MLTMKFEAELQFKSMNTHNFIEVKILQQTSSYMFRASQGSHWGAHNCTELFHNVFCTTLATTQILHTE